MTARTAAPLAGGLETTWAIALADRPLTVAVAGDGERTVPRPRQSWARRRAARTPIGGARAASAPGDEVSGPSGDHLHTPESPLRGNRRARPQEPGQSLTRI